MFELLWFQQQLAEAGQVIRCNIRITVDMGRQVLVFGQDFAMPQADVEAFVGHPNWNEHDLCAFLSQKTGATIVPATVPGPQAPPTPPETPRRRRHQ